jgi:uncharacterized protein (TIGR03084 family)
MEVPLMELSDVRDDLLAEQRALDEVVATLAPAQFALATPSPRWTVADQLGHLAHFDGTATLAIIDPDAFTEAVGDLIRAAADGDEGVDRFVLGPYRQMAPADLVAAWRRNRHLLAEASAGLASDVRVPWYGPPMSPKSFLTARLMECWAHGQDIVDTVGATRPATDRLRHIARLGHLTRGWSYLNRGQQPPEGDVAVVLTSPDGDTWTFGSDADGGDGNRISGPAEDFCLVVTQRRNVADTALVVEGERAADWMQVAQAFAGPATDGPVPKGA